MPEPTEKLLISRCSSVCSSGPQAEGAVITSRPLTNRASATSLCCRSAAWTSGGVNSFFQRIRLCDSGQLNCQTGRSSRSACCWSPFRPRLDCGTTSGVQPRALAACTIQFFVVAQAIRLPFGFRFPSRDCRRSPFSNGRKKFPDMLT